MGNSQSSSDRWFNWMPIEWMEELREEIEELKMLIEREKSRRQDDLLLSLLSQVFEKLKSDRAQGGVNVKERNLSQEEMRAQRLRMFKMRNEAPPHYPPPPVFEKLKSDRSQRDVNVKDTNPRTRRLSAPHPIQEEMRAQRLRMFKMRNEAPPHSPPPPSEESSESGASFKSDQSKDASNNFWMEEMKKEFKQLKMMRLQTLLPSLLSHADRTFNLDLKKMPQHLRSSKKSIDSGVSFMSDQSKSVSTDFWNGEEGSDDDLYYSVRRRYH